jgi:Collagen triple helix repeat (20 copies)
MKRIFTLVAALMLTAGAFAQAPNKMSYQTVIRNGSGALIASTPIGVQISVLQGSASGTAVFVETHAPTTNANGLASLEIGAGTAVTGTFAGIDWSAGPYFIKTETDPLGGTTYTITGTSQLMSVPYALFSANGTPGATGATGANGAAGATGATGLDGIAGAMGATGADGLVGPMGATGADGLVGPMGPMGATGIAGATGLTGATGIDGATGLTGATGIDGATGLTGATGIDGATGLTGAAGATGAAGSNGTNGATGATGAVGANGTNGTNGATGATGAAGANGTNGTNGATGATGAVGANGTNGTNGATGATGAAGANGTNGTNGATGATGAAGAIGAAGATGTAGVAGATGVAGAAGATGATGANGVTGATGPGTLAGTTNYIIKFTSATGGGNSTMQDNGTSISAGLTTPSIIYQMYVYRQQLTVNGDGQTTLYGYRTRDSQNDGVGYSQIQTNRATSGFNFWGDVYTFGDASYNYNDYSRCGGSFGADVNGLQWGSLGYRSSGLLNYGVYGQSAYASGAGRLADGIATGIGAGFHGDLMGGWVRGDVMGLSTQGSMFASYNVGNTYTTGFHADLVKTNGTVTPAFAVTSTSVKVYDDGAAVLSNGTTRVNFTPEFAALVNGKSTVTVSPMGNCNGLYIVSIDEKGFTVAELNNGTSNVEFSYIAVGKRTDAAQASVPAELTKSNFTEKMSGLMFNEGNLKQSGGAMWWNGSNMEYSTPPSLTREQKTALLESQKR